MHSPSYDVGPVQLDDESDEHARGDDAELNVGDVAALLLRLEHAVTLVDENALALGDDWLLELALPHLHPPRDLRDRMHES